MFVLCESGETYTEEQLFNANGPASGEIAGEHTFAVQAIVHNLLVDPIPAEYTWTIEDHAAPETTIVSSPPNPPPPVPELPSQFVFSSDELDASFECSIDPIGIPDYSSCAGPPDNVLELNLEPGRTRSTCARSTRA